MLQIKNIMKKYVTGDLTQIALNDVSLNFRDNEFVAILGPSGSGKTTLLNVVGGLDRYDSGDLIINGVSTKKYKDRDWDSYRNHTIGFVFQSYNLIPHQSVLSNVELALTISGVSGKERKQRAKDALEKVGLIEHIHKRPNQLSGGQMQRVAIARALVNDPDILLADEPTGALDSQTSVQVMELLNEVAKDRLVIMVTHNPELAEEYSTRIVKLKDGKITDDSDPFEVKEEGEAKHKNLGKSKMSRITSLGLSFNNLRTKKGRTILTSFAGSIGIIGIALILSLSNGVNTYIEDIQKDTMTSYPISIESTSFDLSSLMSNDNDEDGDNDGERVEHKDDGVYSNPREFTSVSQFQSSIAENNLTKFKKYLDDKDSEINKYIGENGIVYSYDTKFDVYSYDEDGVLVNADGSNINKEGSIASYFSGNNGFSMNMSESYSPYDNNFDMMIPGKGDKLYGDVIDDNYTVLAGELPKEYNEVVLVLNSNNEIILSSLYKLGILPSKDYKELADKLDNGEEIQLESEKIEYDKIIGREYYVVPYCDYYEKNDDGLYEDIRGNYDKIKNTFKDDLKIKITGIVKINEDADSEFISGTVGYTQALTNYIIDYTDNSDVVKAQNESKDTNVVTGITFESDKEAEKIENAKTYLETADRTEVFTIFQNYVSSLTGGMADMFGTAQGAGDDGQSTDNVDASQITEDMYASQMAEGYERAGAYDMDAYANLSEEEWKASLEEMLKDADDEFFLWVFSEYISTGTYEDALSELGVISLDSPSRIDIYVDSFEDKDGVAKAIENYNKKVADEDEIVYTDFIGLLLKSITTIINVISYVLIAFVAVSLVVSSIMIGIITYISVLERTKEIGILRAIGASKKNISQVFNAETFIIGLGSGIIGIGVTLLLLIPINAIIHAVADSTKVNAILPVGGAIVLIVLSVLLTLLGGFIPSKKAAKKDPVTALRTE